MVRISLLCDRKTTESFCQGFVEEIEMIETTEAEDEARPKRLASKKRTMDVSESAVSRNFDENSFVTFVYERLLNNRNVVDHRDTRQRRAHRTFIQLEAKVNQVIKPPEKTMILSRNF